jgi:ABC-2 type transport system ATP-binding protein
MRRSRPAPVPVGLVADLQRVCDDLVILVESKVRLTGEVDHLLAAHRHLTGPRRDPATLPSTQHVIEESHTDKQSTMLIRTDAPVLDPAWTVTPVSMDDLVLAYMKNGRDADRPARDGLELAR